MKKKRRAVWFGVGAGVGAALGIVALVLVMGGAGGGAAGGAGQDLLEGFPTRAEAPLPGVAGVQVADAEGRMVPSSPSSPSPAQAAEETVPPTILAPQPCDFPQFIGKPVDEAAIKALGRPYRVLPPGSAATMDFSPVRINLETDDKGLVSRITCG